MWWLILELVICVILFILDCKLIGAVMDPNITLIKRIPLVCLHIVVVFITVIIILLIIFITRWLI